MKTLYEKVVSPNGRVTYKEYQPGAGPIYNGPAVDSFTNQELITLGTTLGCVMMENARKLLPEHASNVNKLRNIEDKLKALADSAGAPVRGDMIQYWADCWDFAVKTIQAGLMPR